MDLLESCHCYISLLESEQLLIQKEGETYINVEALTKQQLKKFSDFVASEGYDVRGADDIYKLIKKNRFIQGEHDIKYYILFNNDWIDAAKKVLGIKVKQEQVIKDLLSTVIKKIKKDPDSGIRIVDHLDSTTAYILPSGECLKFQGTVSRADDHRIINAYVPDQYKGNKSQTEIMEFFLKQTGTIRYIPEQCGFDIKARPTTNQYSQIKSAVSKAKSEVALDLWSPNYPKFGKVYKKGVDPKIIYRDIESFYLTGKVRDTSFFED